MSGPGRPTQVSSAIGAQEERTARGVKALPTPVGPAHHRTERWLTQQRLCASAICPWPIFPSCTQDPALRADASSSRRRMNASVVHQRRAGIGSQFGWPVQICQVEHANMWHEGDP